MFPENPYLLHCKNCLNELKWTTHIDGGIYKCGL
jgi:hypothetical protein